MPNTGLPSRDCGLCRKRRVKCDLERPQCTRCLKYGATCPGYRTEDDLLFRNESVISVKGRHQRRICHVRERQAPAAITTSDKSVSSSSRSSSASPPPAPSTRDLTTYIPRRQSPRTFQVTEDWRLHAIPRLLRHLSYTLGNDRHYGTYDFFPPLLQESSDDSCLRLVTDAFAQTLFRRINHHEVARDPQAVNMVGRALAAVNDTLRHPQKCRSDATLVSIWLLSLYEVLVDSPMEMTRRGPTNWYLHVAGFASLIRLKGSEMFSTLRNRHMFWLMLHDLQMRNLGSNLPCPPETRRWLEQLAQSRDDEDQLPLLVSTYYLRFEALMAMISDIIYTASIERACEICVSVLAKVDVIGMIELDRPNSGLQDISNDNHLRWWQLYWSIQAKFHWHLAMFLNLADACPCARRTRSPEALETQRRESLKTARATMQNILDTVPGAYDDEIITNKSFFLASGSSVPCGADVYRISGHLILVCAVHASTSEQKRRARKELDRLGQQYGVGVARQGVRELLLPPILTKGILESASIRPHN